MIPETQVRQRLKTYLYQRYSTLRMASDFLGCSNGFLSEVLNDKRPVPDWLLREIGMTKRRVWVYSEAEKREKEA